MFCIFILIIEECFGIWVEVGEVGGSWLEDFYVREFILSDVEGVWFYVDYVDFVWYLFVWFDDYLKIDFFLFIDV